MWFPVDDGMVNLERVALIRIGDSLDVKFFNDARAHLTTASFDSERAFREYVDQLQQELPAPIIEAEEAEKFPADTSVLTLASSGTVDEPE